jgi:hypothetical protein
VLKIISPKWIKEDTSYLNAKRLDFGQDKVKIFNDSRRDYGAIDGDLIKATVIHNYIPFGK